MAGLEHDDIQGYIVPGYPFRRALHLFVEIQKADGGRKLLEQLVPELTSAKVDPNRSAALNLALSYEGLKALGVDQETRHGFPEAFRQGMFGRAHELGDDPPDWEPFWRSRKAHVWLSIHGARQSDIEGGEQKIRSLIEALSGLSLGHRQAGEAIERGGRRFEHFGFADGISNPVIAETQASGAATSTSNRPLKAGEFLLGYEDEFGEIPRGPDPTLAHNGTFVVFRKLKQDVARFRNYVQSIAQRHGLDPKVVGAKMVGRHEDGRPLGRSTTNRSADGDAPDNDFDFSDDPVGAVCPLGAHIRRANPRNGTHLPEVATRHRMLRRGMPYGKPLENGEDDREERGLLFIAMNASLERQYEFVQKRWMNDGVDQGQGADPDPIVNPHDGSRKMVVQGDEVDGRVPVVFVGLPRFVTSRGGEYFFMPGLAALRRLAVGRWNRAAAELATQPSGGRT